MTTIPRVAALAAVFTVAITAACSQPLASKMIPGHVELTLGSVPAGSANARFVLTRIAGDTALDTTVVIPAGATSLSVDLNVSIDRAFFTTGEPLSMTVTFRGATGQSIFISEPSGVTARPR